MPVVSKSVQDALRAYDRNLALMYDSKRKRWVVNRFGAGGRYDEVFVVEGANGEFLEPRKDVIDRIFANDLSRYPGLTSRQRIDNMLRAQEGSNQQLREAERAKTQAAMDERARDWANAAHQGLGDDPVALEKHMRKDREIMKDMDLTDSAKKRILRGEDAY